MRLGAAGEALIKRFESLELEAYPDPGSALGKAIAATGRLMRHYREIPGWQNVPGHPWTIGWGHTGNVKPGDKITIEQANLLFATDVLVYEDGVNRLVTVPVNQNQFDALVSFAYNVGLDIDTDNTPEGLGDSTLLKYVNQRKFVLADGEFLKWNKSGGAVSLGLVRRRRAERELFMKPVA